MKKIYFLLFTLIATASFGQELLLNGDFESWTDPMTLNDWTKYENTVQEATEVHSGSFAAVQTASGTKDIAQTVTGIVPGTSYTLTVWFKVDAATADGTDARIWSKWSTDGAVDHATDADVLQGPGGGYFDNNGNVWTEYTTTVTAPATANEFYFEVRAYGSAVVYWDDFSFFQEAGAIPTLSITSPANGSTIASSDVDVEFSVQNFVVGNPGAGIDGHLHYYLDGAASPTMIYTTDAIALTGLANGSHTLDLELVDNSHQPLADPVTASVTFDVVTPTQVADLAALRAGTIGDFYELMNTPTVTYTRASRNQKYIQDGSAAILIDDTAGNIATTFAIGDGISGLVGQLGAYQGIMQFIPSGDATVETGATITPEVVTIATLLTDFSDYQSELIQINDVTFADGGGTFATSTNYDISDPSARLAGPMTFRPFNEADYIGEVIPATAAPVVAIVAEFGGSPQISARSLTDLTLSVNAFEANQFNVYPNPVTNGLVNITSKSNEAIAVTVFDILGKQVINQTVNNNILNVTSLTSGVYILKISQNGNVTTKKLVLK